jgi:4'-phosphopantetheinyl transferase
MSKMNMNLSWDMPPLQLQLSREDIHIWRASLDLPSKRVQEINKNLSSDERLRAELFCFERDRNRFIAARGILRQILTCYLSVEPSAIRFCYEKNGKPRLQNTICKTGIQFNLSHSEGLALYVFSRGHEVGVDVEFMREISEMEQIVEQFFSVSERNFFGRLPTRKKQETFFNWWTRKEAFAKAIGEGLSYPLGSFDATLADGNTLESSGISEDSDERPRWSMLDVRPAEEFAGAVVVGGNGWNVQSWQWPA